MKSFFGGFVTAIAFLPLGFATSSVLELAGINFSFAFAAIFLSAGIGTLLWTKFENSPIILFPELSIVASLIYIDVISCGVPFETVLSSFAVASIVGIILAFTTIGKNFFLKCEWNGGIKFAFLAGMAFFLILEGLYQGRLIIPSPFHFAMIGDIENPVFAVSLIGIVIFLFLYAVGFKFAITASTVVAVIISYLEGYIAIENVFLVPDRLFYQNFIEFLPKFDLVLKFLFVMWIVGFILQDFWGNATKTEHKRPMLIIFAINAISSCFGAFMLLPSPLSALPISMKDGKKTSCFVSLFFLLFVFLEPLASSLNSFTAVYAPATVAIGILTIVMAKNVNFVKEDWKLPNILAATAFITIFPLTRDIVAAIFTAILLFLFIKYSERFFKI